MFNQVIPACGYNVGKVIALKVLEHDNFIRYQFQGDGLEDTGRVEIVYTSGVWHDIKVSEDARFNSSDTNAGLKQYTVQTFIDEISANMLNPLFYGRQKRFVVLFQLASGKWFIYGDDAGARLAYASQTEEALGQVLTLTAQSSNQLYEIINIDSINGVAETVVFEFVLFGAFCDMVNMGYLQAIVGYFRDEAGRPLDINGIPAEISGLKAAIYLLEGEENPDPELYDVVGTFAAGAEVMGIASLIYNDTLCPVTAKFPTITDVTIGMFK